MTDMVVPGAHASDGDLVRYVDGEGDAEERAALLAHVDACGECAARLARQQRRTERLSAMLRAGDFPVPAMTVPAAADPTVVPFPRRVAVQPWMRAAALVVLAVGAGTVWSTLRSGGGGLPNAALEQGPAPETGEAAAAAPAPIENSVGASTAEAGDAAGAAKSALPLQPALEKPGIALERRVDMANGRAAPLRRTVTGGSGSGPAAAGTGTLGAASATRVAAPMEEGVAQDVVVTAAPSPPAPPPPPVEYVPAPPSPAPSAASAASARDARGDSRARGETFSAESQRAMADTAAAAEEKRTSALRMARLPASRLVFAPTGEELHVKVARTQGAGAVVLLAPQGTQGAAEVAGAYGPDLSYEAGTVRIANPEGATADYRIRLPGTVRRVLVTVGDAKPIAVDAQAIAGSQRVELRAP
jgi:hypothetical protein